MTVARLKVHFTLSPTFSEFLTKGSDTGKIMRHTIPKSQGKQAYYDARKSEWGDSFPHAPKNAPQERYTPTRDSRKATPVKGGDIGKRGVDVTWDKGKHSYSNVAEQVKERKKQIRRERLVSKESV